MALSNRLERLLDLKLAGSTHGLTLPDPEKSIGIWYRKLGRYQCWEMRGEAQAQYLILANEIKDYLEKHGEVVTDTVIWSAYMIGRSKSTAIPTVFFCSRNSAARKTVKKEIDKSGILDKYSWFKIADSTRPPHLEDLRQLTDRVATDEKAQLLRPCFCGNPTGTKILAFRGDTSSPTVATVGVVLESQGHFYITTVAHAFDESHRDNVFSLGDDSGFEFDIDDIDDSASDIDDQDAPHTGDIDHSEDICDLEAKQGHLYLDKYDQWKPGDVSASTYDYKDVVFASSSGSTSSLDYCILKYKDEYFGRFRTLAVYIDGCDFHPVYPKAIGTSVPHQSRVVAYTSSQQVQRGQLSGTPTYISSGLNQKTQELWSVHFGGPLFLGDCGSLVVNEKTAELEGHIVAGSPTTGVALIVPAYQIFNDLRKRFDQNITLPLDAESCNDLAFALIDWADPKVFTHEFRKMLRLKRQQRLAKLWSLNKRVMKDVSEGERTYIPLDRFSVSNLPVIPQPPVSEDGVKFSSQMKARADAPLQWEDTELRSIARRSIPIEKLEMRARGRYDEDEATALSSNSAPVWSYQEHLLQELLEWFKRDFFAWVNNPQCSKCQSQTAASSKGQPTAEEKARGAYSVELYVCENPHCRALERFPRYSGALELLKTRKGRTGEWVNCFGLLCRALSARIRWIWNAEGYMWVEVYSQQQRRWVHADPCLGVWDRPLIYTRGLQNNLSYCIAFSAEGATDVTCRYVRDGEFAAGRTKVSEEELVYILHDIQKSRRQALCVETQEALSKEDALEEREFLGYRAEMLVPELCRTATLHGIGTNILLSEQDKNIVQLTKELEEHQIRELREGSQFPSAR